MPSRLPPPLPCRPPTSTEFNQLVVGAYKTLVSSPMGRHLVEESGEQAAIESTLSIPLYIVEDFLRQRVRARVSRSWRRWAWLAGSRVSLATAGGPPQGCAGQQPPCAMQRLAGPCGGWLIPHTCCWPCSGLQG